MPEADTTLNDGRPATVSHGTPRGPGVRPSSFRPPSARTAWLNHRLASVISTSYLIGPFHGAGRTRTFTVSPVRVSRLRTCSAASTGAAMPGGHCLTTASFWPTPRTTVVHRRCGYGPVAGGPSGVGGHCRPQAKRGRHDHRPHPQTDDQLGQRLHDNAAARRTAGAAIGSAGHGDAARGQGGERRQHRRHRPP